jgi:hypothetical protein
MRRILLLTSQPNAHIANPAAVVIEGVLNNLQSFITTDNNGWPLPSISRIFEVDIQRIYPSPVSLIRYPLRRTL